MRWMMNQRNFLMAGASYQGKLLPEWLRPPRGWYGSRDEYLMTLVQADKAVHVDVAGQGAVRSMLARVEPWRSRVRELALASLRSRTHAE